MDMCSVMLPDGEQAASDAAMAIHYWVKCFPWPSQDGVTSVRLVADVTVGVISFNNLTERLALRAASHYVHMHVIFLETPQSLDHWIQNIVVLAPLVNYLTLDVYKLPALPSYHRHYANRPLHTSLTTLMIDGMARVGAGLLSLLADAGALGCVTNLSLDLFTDEVGFKFALPCPELLPALTDLSLPLSLVTDGSGWLLAWSKRSGRPLTRLTLFNGEDGKASLVHLPSQCLGSGTELDACVPFCVQGTGRPPLLDSIYYRCEDSMDVDDGWRWRCRRLNIGTGRYGVPAGIVVHATAHVLIVGREASMPAVVPLGVHHGLPQSGPGVVVMFQMDAASERSAWVTHAAVEHSLIVDENDLQKGPWQARRGLAMQPIARLSVAELVWLRASLQATGSRWGTWRWWPEGAGPFREMLVALYALVLAGHWDELVLQPIARAYFWHTMPTLAEGP